MEREQFLNSIQDYIQLLGSYFNKKVIHDLIISNSQLSIFVKLSKHHSLTALLYKALVDTKVQADQEELNKLEQYYLACLRKAVLFDRERNELYSYLNENRIDFLPLKGIILKDYYLDPFTREFADNDILFPDQYSACVKSFFIKRGYAVEGYKKWNHDTYIKKPFYNFEMHRSLFVYRADNKKMVRYFEGYLEKAPIKEKYEHYLTNEDFYIYFLAHSYKHFHSSGCGIRTLIDIYLYIKKEQLDFDYINQELDKIGLLNFSNQIVSLSNKIFNNESLNESEEEMLLFIASSGTYGLLENNVEKGIREKGRFGYFLSRAFPPYISYKTTYPWAYKCPILIPIAWADRLIRNSRRASSELKMIKKQMK